MFNIVCLRLLYVRCTITNFNYDWLPLALSQSPSICCRSTKFCSNDNVWRAADGKKKNEKKNVQTVVRHRYNHDHSILIVSLKCVVAHKVDVLLSIFNEIHYYSCCCQSLLLSLFHLLLSVFFFC